MRQYFFYRFLLIVPTLVLILSLNFFLVANLPGGPIDYVLHKLHMHESSYLTPWNEPHNIHQSSLSTVEQSIHPTSLLEKKYGLDNSTYHRYLSMLYALLQLDFGISYYHSLPVFSLILSKLPISFCLSFLSCILSYLLAISLGTFKALYPLSTFDRITNIMLLSLKAIPTILLAFILLHCFANAEILYIFPSHGLTSYHHSQLSLLGKFFDYAWHLVLPVVAMSASTCASLCFLVKHTIQAEMHKTYVIQARAKGLSEPLIIYHHVLHNALLSALSNLPVVFKNKFFSGALFIEIVFSLDGIGQLSYQAIITRDYPVVFGCLFIFTLIGLIVNIAVDLCYWYLDKRIDYRVY